MRRRDHNIFANATSLLICGLLAGVVVAAAAFPAVAMSGLAAKTGSQSFAALPSELKAATAPQITRIFASDGKTQIAVMYDEFRSDVPLKDISVNMQHAIVAAEDHDFYHHKGVDLKGVARAFVNNNSGKSQQGASTLTMQVVRMTLAYSATNPQEVVDATQDTPKRKINEMKYALQIEKEESKDQILERYLNIAPFGNSAYGVYAASKVYFNTTPNKLTVAQAALLASFVKAPTAFNPTTASGYPQALARRNYVVNDMKNLGYVTAAQAAAAQKVKIGRTVQRVGNGCVSVAKNNWGFFCDYFYRWWLSQETFGATTYDRERRLKSGGYRIVTSMDIKAQNSARKRINQEISNGNKNALLLAGVEPGTGRVRVLAANRNYKLDDKHNGTSSDPAKAAKGKKGTYPNTTNPILTGGGDINGYQAGSTFKMFTMVAALEKGLPLATTINAQKVAHTHYVVGYNSSAACPGTHDYCPGNAGESEAGVYNMWTGFGSSVNTFFVPLEEQVGAQNVVDVAKRFGIQFRAAQDAKYASPGYANQWGAFTLGVSASTPLDKANAYATLAGDGMYCQPTPVQEIKTQSGEKIDVGNPHCTRATSSDVARAALDAARCPVGDYSQLSSCGGHSTAPGAHYAVNHPIYGKTGTTDGSKTAALIIGSTSLTIAGYLVNPDYANHHDEMEHGIVNPAVWNTMADYLRGNPQIQFKKPGSDKISIGEQRSIPDVKCDSAGSAKAQIEGAGFQVSVSGDQIASDCPAGTVAATSPDGHTIKNGFVSLQLSSGPKSNPTKNPGQTPPIIVNPPGHKPGH
jgi:membrane peptidoglycan carboxypeptidase